MMTVIQPLPSTQRIPVTDGDGGGTSPESPPPEKASPPSAPTRTSPAGSVVSPDVIRPAPAAAGGLSSQTPGKTLQGIVPTTALAPATPAAAASMVNPIPPAPAVPMPAPLPDKPAEEVASDAAETPPSPPTDTELRTMRKTYRVPVEKLARRRTSSHFLIVIILLIVVVGIVAATLVLTGNTG